MVKELYCFTPAAFSDLDHAVALVERSITFIDKVIGEFDHLLF